MEPEQYELTSRAEDHHWWFLGWRDLVARCLQVPDNHLPAHPAILDAGCGTGGNLRFLNQLLSPSYLSGFDCSPTALHYARQKCATAELNLGDIRAPRPPARPVDLLLCCDVIYVPGMAASQPGLQLLMEHLAPGGLFILHLPAYRWLTSHHDRVMHTSERYLLRDALRLTSDLELKPLRASYRLCALLPLIIMRRLPSLIRPAQRPLQSSSQSSSPRSAHRSSPQSDLTLPPSWLNRWLLWIVQVENRCIARGMRMPWGSSVFVMAKKAGSERQRPGGLLDALSTAVV